MFYRKDAAVALAVGTLLISAGLAKAETPKLSLDSSVVTMDDAAPQGLLMQGLDKIGAAAPLQKAGINVFGYAEAGWLYNVNHSSGEINVGHIFTAEPGSHVQLNQVDLAVERLVDASGKKFDIGGRIEFVYGTDSAFIHSNGLNFYAGMDALSPTYQFDPEQVYVDVAIPVGNGLKIRAGKFATLLGYEYINPTQNPFYSHSYLFNDSINFTETGVIGTYTFNDQWALTAGVVRGWDVATKDNNGAVSGTWSLAYTPNKKLSVYFNGITGPEGATFDAIRGVVDNNTYYTTVFDAVATYKLSDMTTVGANGDFGWNADGDHLWYGVALYGSQVINDYLTANVRGEWMNDSDNTRLGFANAGLDGMGQVDVYELTLGVTVKPFPKHDILKNLVIRPEARIDYSDREAFGGAQLGASGEHWQFTTGADVIFTF